MINNYYIGMPITLGKVVGRIVGAHEDCAWATNENGVEIPSIVDFSTPHGTVIKSGISYLDSPDSEQLDKLKGFEKMVIDEGKEIYAGRLLPEHYTETLSENI